jgi:GrpB-like predicted nucleotidyltransferase (UPF0157 family)
MRDEVEFIGGSAHRTIKIVSYDQNWPKKFEKHKETIQKALGSTANRIDHIGSTSVPDLPAKPIIDIQVSIDNPENESTYVPKLEKHGYILRVREDGHRMLRTPELDVHIHICQSGSDWEQRHLLLKDWLLRNEKDKIKYQKLKEKLSKQNWKTMNHYADAKGELIEEIMKRAEEWAADTNWKPQQSQLQR